MDYISKSELDSLFKLSSTLPDTLERLKELEAQVDTIRVQNTAENIGAGRTNSTTNYVEDLVIQLDELRKMVISEKTEYLMLVNKMVYSTKGLEKKYKDVMHYRYVKGLDWKDLPYAIHTSRRTAERIHGEALQIIKGRRVEAGKKKKS